MKTITITNDDFNRLLSLAWLAVNDGLTTNEGLSRDEAFLERLDLLSNK